MAQDKRFTEQLEWEGRANVALFHADYDEQHLEQVKAKMVELGAPSIRAIWSECYGMYLAIEGCHRLRAAHALGIIPTIIDVSDSETVAIQWDGEDAEFVTVELMGELEDGAHRAAILEFTV